MSTDCGCEFYDEAGVFSMCEPHWVALDEELAREPRVVAALIAALTRHKNEVAS